MYVILGAHAPQGTRGVSVWDAVSVLSPEAPEPAAESAGARRRGLLGGFAHELMGDSHDELIVLSGASPSRLSYFDARTCSRAGSASVSYH